MGLCNSCFGRKSAHMETEDERQAREEAIQQRLEQVRLTYVVMCI